MLQINRRSEIARIVADKGFVSVDELVEQFKVTGETVRRDLKYLEVTGSLKRAHGGAYSERALENDVKVEVRQDRLIEGKKQIAELCSQWIHSGDTIFLDSSTTVLEIAKRVAHMRITILTNSFLVTEALYQYKNVRLIQLGGIFNDINMCFTGKFTLSAMQTYFAKKAFISCRSLSLKHGAMDSNEQIGLLRSLALANCSECYLVADHTKLNNVSLCKIGELQQFSGIILDQDPGAEWKEQLQILGVPLYFPKQKAIEQANKAMNFNKNTNT